MAHLANMKKVYGLDKAKEKKPETAAKEKKTKKLTKAEIAANKAAEKAKVKKAIKAKEKASTKKKAEVATDDSVIAALIARKEGITKSIVNMRKQIVGISARIKARRVSNAKKRALAKGKKKPAVV